MLTNEITPHKKITNCGKAGEVTRAGEIKSSVTSIWPANKWTGFSIEPREHGTYFEITLSAFRSYSNIFYANFLQINQILYFLQMKIKGKGLQKWTLFARSLKNSRRLKVDRCMIRMEELEEFEQKYKKISSAPI